MKRDGFGDEFCSECAKIQQPLYVAQAAQTSDALGPNFLVTMCQTPRLENDSSDEYSMDDDDDNNEVYPYDDCDILTSFLMKGSLSYKSAISASVFQYREQEQRKDNKYFEEEKLAIMSFMDKDTNEPGEQIDCFLFYEEVIESKLRSTNNLETQIVVSQPPSEQIDSNVFPMNEQEQKQDRTIKENEVPTNLSCQEQFKRYIKREVAKFFGVDEIWEERERIKWSNRHVRFALRRFGELRAGADMLRFAKRPRPEQCDCPPCFNSANGLQNGSTGGSQQSNCNYQNDSNGCWNTANECAMKEPHWFPFKDEINENDVIDEDYNLEVESNSETREVLVVEKKPPVAVMIFCGLQYIARVLLRGVPKRCPHGSRSFALEYVANYIPTDSDFTGIDNRGKFFDSPSESAMAPESLRKPTRPRICTRTFNTKSILSKTMSSKSPTSEVHLPKPTLSKLSPSKLLEPNCTSSNLNPINAMQPSLKAASSPSKAREMGINAPANQNSEVMERISTARMNTSMIMEDQTPTTEASPSSAFPSMRSLPSTQSFSNSPSLTATALPNLQSPQEIQLDSGISSANLSCPSIVTTNYKEIITKLLQSSPENNQIYELYFDENTQYGWRTETCYPIFYNESKSPKKKQKHKKKQQQHKQVHQTKSQFINGYCCTRISPKLMNIIEDNSFRRSQETVKFLNILGMNDRYDYRSYFTYWINTVQILILCLTLFFYGFGPLGVGMEQKSSQVLVTSLSLQQVQYEEPRSIWLGARGDDLVHLGAKYSACMRRDFKVINVLARTRIQERETACCIRNDDSGCVQSLQEDCSGNLWPAKSVSTTKKWTIGEPTHNGRISGSVCGLDLKHCEAPASNAPFEWPDDITKWPICRKPSINVENTEVEDHVAEHMVCEVIGHPCCISVHGECRITTREFCDFVHGYFHEEASLCSQVSCLNDVCGMFPFMIADTPDQVYRLLSSLFLHAGVIHVAITLSLHHALLSDFEKLIGSVRMAILYLGSGVAGNLASSLFLPFKPEVGPLASIAGILASMTVVLLTIHWKYLKRPHMAILKNISLAMCLIVISTLPWQQHAIALLGGFASGTALTIIYLPFLSLQKYNREAKAKLMWRGTLAYLLAHIIALILFYIFPNEFSSIGWSSSEYSDLQTTQNGPIGGSYSVGGNIIACDNNKGMQCGGTSNNMPDNIARTYISL